ncbi:hypothetical protein GEMRC1_001709 [Eukaryota sp. GEM-RC1]
MPKHWEKRNCGFLHLYLPLWTPVAVPTVEQNLSEQTESLPEVSSPILTTEPQSESSTSTSTSCVFQSHSPSTSTIHAFPSEQSIEPQPPAQTEATPMEASDSKPKVKKRRLKIK